MLIAPTGFLLSMVGLVIGQAQTLSSALIVIASGWMLFSVSRQPIEAMSAGAEPLAG